MSNLLPRLEFGLQALVCHQRVCPFCQGRHHAVVARKHGVVRIRQCNACSLYFTDPIYKSRIASLYDSPLLQRGRIDDDRAAASPSSRRSKRRCSTRPTKTAAPRLMRSGTSERGNDCSRSARRGAISCIRRTAAGFDAIGVEPNRVRREYGVRELGTDIRSSIDDVPAGGFDVIYTAHTLEHISQPNVFFSECYDRLRPGGLLAIEVPHFDLALLGPRALSVIGAVHPLGLSQSFFRIALPQAGFKPLGDVRRLDLGARRVVPLRRAKAS